MASRKQRKRRTKEMRHEYELVLVDEDGEERPLDTAELRADRRDKSSATGERKNAPAGKIRTTDSKGRPLRVVQPPAWNRVWKRALVFGAFMFVVLTFVGGKKHTLTDTLIPTLLYTVLFVPMLYLLDRVQYNQYLKRTGQPVGPRGAASAGTAKKAQPEGDAGEGRVAGIRRALRG